MTKNKQVLSTLFFLGLIGITAHAQNVTYQPYIQPGDNGPFGPYDQMIVAWQTDEKTPGDQYRVEWGESAGDYFFSGPLTGRVVDNYLAADPALPVPPTAPGAHVNYTAVLKGLDYDRQYFYRVTGPSLPAAGFRSSFHTRKRSGNFSFAVEGDEGFFPSEPGSPARIANLEGRIAYLISQTHKLQIPGVPRLPRVDFAINTGDNVYNVGSEGSYRDFWMPVWNSDTASPDKGAPFVRSTPYYIVAGNHDTGGNGDFVNMLGNGASHYTGNSEGGDNLAYFNNYYFPLNGPKGVDSSHVFHGDTVTDDGWYWQYNGERYTTTAAAQAFRKSTEVNSGHGRKQQIDHMANYSVDYGNAHFVFLDANPHLFDSQISFSNLYSSPQVGFSNYPSVLNKWLTHDLDSSDQLWKFVVFHQPSFSSGNGTLRNFQMRAVAKLLEDHGVSVVFNGHEHNYQRTLPLRALEGVTTAPTVDGNPVVALDRKFNGKNDMVPNGVIYIIDGAGGNRDFDGGTPSPRGQGADQVDEDDSATGTYTYPNEPAFPQGSASWLDTHLTNAEMSPFLGSTAGAGPKITSVFKARVFSFSDVQVHDNKLTLFQISEPLLKSSSASSDNPYPFGSDINGKALNDPLPDTLIDPQTGQQVSPSSPVGEPALLDAFSIQKIDLSGELVARLTHAKTTRARSLYVLRIQNHSKYDLNGVQAVFNMPNDAAYDDAEDNTTVEGRRVVKTIGHLAAGKVIEVEFKTKNAALTNDDDEARNERYRKVFAIVRSATALPVNADPGENTRWER